MEPSVIRILIVDDVPETRQNVEKLLQMEPDFNVVGTAVNGREGIQRAAELQPDIVLMDINMPDMNGLDAARQMSSDLPMIGVIMMSVQHDADYLHQAMRGARAFLTKPLDTDKLYATVREVYVQCEPLRRAFKVMKDNPDLDAVTPPGPGGNIIVVYSPTGGAGCTTLAINLASALTRPKTKTLLVDGCLPGGTVAPFLALNSRVGVADALEVVDELDLDYFDNVVTTHNSGLRVLPAPAGKHSMSIGLDIRDGKPEALARLVEQIAPHYDFVVVDAGKSIDNLTAPLLEQASRLVLVVNPTLPSVTSVYALLDWLNTAGYPMHKICLVVNKAREGKHTPSPEKIQQYLRQTVAGVIPAVDEDMLLNAINRGMPLLAAEPDATKTPVRQIFALANHLYESLAVRGKPAQEDTPAQARGIFATLTKMLSWRENKQQHA